MMYNNLNIDVIDLPLIGEKRQQALASVGVHTLEDLLYYVPRAYLDRSSVKPIGQLIVGEECTVVGVVQRIRMIPTKKRKILKIEIMDNSGILTLNWFHGSEWIQKTFQVGDTVSVFGKIADTDDYVFFIVDSKHEKYECIQNVINGQHYVSEFQPLRACH